MMFPPSLSEHVKAQAFRAHNGELGILPSDTGAFLQACRFDKVRVLGWELWIVDHQWNAETSRPAPAPGCWSGGVPVPEHDFPAVFGGEGDISETERQIASIDFETAVQGVWLPHVRVNFTLDN